MPLWWNEYILVLNTSAREGLSGRTLQWHQRFFVRVALLASIKTETLAVWKDRRLYADIVLAVSTVVFQTTGIGSNPIICSSRPAALTHSPTPGSKKCGVLSKGFLASKSKPVHIPLRWHVCPFESGKGDIFNTRPMRGRPGRPIQLPNNTLG